MPIYRCFSSKNATFGNAARGPRDGLVWYRDGRKMATGQYRSAISLDDVAQKTTLARSAHQNNSERTSKPLEEQCDEFVPLVSLRFQGVKTIDVIERNRPPKNSVALEPGDLEVDFVPFFSMFLVGQKKAFSPLPGRSVRCSDVVVVVVVVAFWLQDGTRLKQQQVIQFSKTIQHK